MDQVHRPNRKQPETGELEAMIRRRNQRSEYRRADPDAYFASTGVHIDGGQLRGLIRGVCPGAWLIVNSYGNSEVTPPSRCLRLSRHEELLQLDMELLSCACCGHEAREPVILYYRVSKNVHFVRSGYTIYPIRDTPAPGSGW